VTVATIIPARGHLFDVQPANGRAFTLADLQKIVGGYIEALRAPDGRLMFLNEDGKRLRLPLNPTATYLLRGRLRVDDYIVGDVVLCNAIEAGEGDEGDEGDESGPNQA
jgi:hypothetical protein